MKITPELLKALPGAGLAVKEKQVDGRACLLIGPRKDKFDWLKEERVFRSVIVDKATGEFLSTGWPKFGNLFATGAEFPEDLALLERDLKAKAPIRFTKKEDGTLIIVDRIRDTIWLRTRGCFPGDFDPSERGTDFPGRARELLLNRYPKFWEWINQPGPVQETTSLLFEYLEAGRKVVVKYDQDDLVFLGMVDKQTLQLAPWPSLESFAKIFGLNLVPLFDLPRSISELNATVQGWKEIEGIVVRCNLDQTLIKLKSAWYLAMHRARFSMNYGTIVEMLEQLYGSPLTDVKDLPKKYDVFKDFLKTQAGWDEELVASAMTFFQRVERNTACVNSDLWYAKSWVDRVRFELETLPDYKAKKKELAERMRHEPGVASSLAFAYYDDKLEKALKSYYRKHVQLGE